MPRLWERFGLRLLERYGSFLEAFKALDEDESGLVDKSEFTQAYVDILAAPLPEGALEAGRVPKSVGRPSSRNEGRAKGAPKSNRSRSKLPKGAEMRAEVGPKAVGVGRI